MHSSCQHLNDVTPLVNTCPECKFVWLSLNPIHKDVMGSCHFWHLGKPLSKFYCPLSLIHVFAYHVAYLHLAGLDFVQKIQEVLCPMRKGSSMSCWMKHTLSWEQKATSILEKRHAHGDFVSPATIPWWTKNKSLYNKISHHWWLSRSQTSNNIRTLLLHGWVMTSVQFFFCTQCLYWLSIPERERERE